MAELPTQRDFEDFSAWTGRDVLAPDGERLGAVEVIFLDEATDLPEWVLVRLEDADHASFVPLAGASVEERAIRVEQDRERIAAAPQLEVEDTLTVAECRRLYDHYGLAYSREESPTILPEGATSGGDANAGARDGDADGDREQRPRLRKYVGAPVPAAETESPTDETDAAANTELRDSTTDDAGDDEVKTGDASTEMPETKGTGPAEPVPNATAPPTPIGPPPPRAIPPEGGFQASQGGADEPGGRLASLKRRPALPITLAGGIAALIGILVLRKRR